MKYYKNAPKLHVDKKLEGMLSQFKTIEDFRVVEPEIDEMIGNLKQNSNKRRHRSMSESEGVAAVPGKATGTTVGQATGMANNSGDRKRFVLSFCPQPLKLMILL